MEEKDTKMEEQYPSVELAYEFVKPSYDWMLNRIEAINSKIQNLITFATTLTAATPILIKAVFDNVVFDSVLFYLAMVCYVLIAVIGIIALRGSVRLINPTILYNKWLDKSPWKFKKDNVYWAGVDFNENKKRVEHKTHRRDIMAFLLLVEVICILVWIVVVL